MITIINKTKSPITFNLSRPEHRERVTLQRFAYDPNSGHRYTQRVKAAIGTSITLLAREHRHNLPDAYEHEEEVQNALRAKQIKIIKIAEESAAELTQIARPELTTPIESIPAEEPTTETRSHRRRIAPTFDKE